MRNVLSTVIFLSLFFAFSGCGQRVGTVKPEADQSSATPRVADLTQLDPDWQRLSSNELSEAAYQSRKTGSIISFSTACGKNQTAAQPEASLQEQLRDASKLLLMGITDIQLRKENLVTVLDQPALETTIRGKIKGDEMLIRAVVLKRGNCVYDLMYIARPQDFPQHELTFANFVKSLR